jgi:metal-responsive CopG/Arc/MetJ family transcriptional regulator
MAYRKTAIAVPEEILDQVDRAAQERGESRTGFIVRVLRAAVRARRDAQITRKLDALFAEESVREETLRETEALEEIGVDWSDERW